MTNPVVCYGCKYAPIELLAGFGATSQQIMVEPDSFEAAERLAHGNLCGFGKSVIACGLSPNVHQMVLTTCCDVMRRCYDVLRAQHCLDFLYLLDIPHVVTPASQRLLANELRKLAQAYADFSGNSFEVGAALAAIKMPPAPKPGSVALVGAHAPQSLLDELDSELHAPVVNHTCTGERVLAQPPLELAHAARSRRAAAAAPWPISRAAAPTPPRSTPSSTGTPPRSSPRRRACAWTRSAAARAWWPAATRASCTTP